MGVMTGESRCNSRSDRLEVLCFLNHEVLSNEEGGEQMIYEKVQDALSKGPG